MKRINVIWTFMTSCLFMNGTCPAQEEVTLKVQSKELRQIILAVSPFTHANNADITDRVRRILINDLELSGFFQIIDLKQSNGNMESSSPFFSESTRIPERASVLLEGQIDTHDEVLSLSMRLEELSMNQTIFDKTYANRLSGYRTLAHQVSDEIGYYLTGDPGISSTKIAFMHVDGEAKEIAIVDYDGYGFTRLTNSGTLNLSPRWSPDGQRLIYTSYETGRPDFQVMRLKDGLKANLSRYGELHSAPSWSPNGRRIALTLATNGNSDIYTMDLRGRRLRRLTHSHAIDSSPSWSPDGREIAFTSGRSGSPQIYIMESDGGNIRRLTYEGRYNASPAWSPKGDLIAYVSREESGFQIYTIDVNGENIRRVTDGTGNNENPSWSPNGVWLTFASNRQGRWDIYIIQREGRHLRRVTTTGGNLSPSWSPRLEYE